MNERVLECKVEERVDSLANKQENGIKGRERRKQKKTKEGKKDSGRKQESMLRSGSKREIYRKNRMEKRGREEGAEMNNKQNMGEIKRINK